jgi:hypothetical protein
MSEGTDRRVRSKRRALFQLMLSYVSAVICFYFVYWSRTLEIARPGVWDFISGTVLFWVGFGFLFYGTFMLWRVVRRMEVSVEEDGLKIVRLVGGALRKETQVDFDDIVYVQQFRDKSLLITYRDSSWKRLTHSIDILDDEIPDAFFFRKLKERGIRVAGS